MRLGKRSALVFIGASLLFTLLLQLSNGYSMSELLAATQAAQTGSFHWRQFLAPFHTVLLHFPIAFLTLACILEVYAALRPSPEVKKVSFFVLGLACLSAPAVALLGFLRASGGGYDPEMLLWHKTFGSSVAILAVVVWLVGWYIASHGAGRLLQLSYRCLLGSTLIIIVIAGHLGGNLAHGSRYLVKNAPAFLRQYFMSRAQASDTVHPGKLSDAELDFKKTIEPILEAKCRRCHGSEGHMSGYRLDVKALVFKGGRSGVPAIVPGNPMKSNLVRVILLPEEHEGGMPPPGAERLSADEILAIVHWIQSGAAFVEATVPD